MDSHSLSKSNFGLRKIVHISAISQVIWGFAFICPLDKFWVIHIQMRFNGGVFFDLDSWNARFPNTVMGIDYPKVGKLVSVSFNIPATKYRSNYFSRAWIFRNQSVFLGCINNKGIVETSLDTIIYIDTPVP